MKITSLKSLDNYIYASVILPLKDLDYSLPQVSPIEAGGYTVTFLVKRGNADLSDMQHNYQREEAVRNAPYLVHVKGRSMEFKAAVYDVATHEVTVYADMFEKKFPKSGRYLAARLVKAFSENTPFGVVTIEAVKESGELVFDISELTWTSQ